MSRQLALALASSPPPTFDNFVAGRNSEVMARLQWLCGAPAGERFVYLWGPPACGRTHLLKATVAAFKSAGARATYIACGNELPLTAETEESDCTAVDDVDRLDDAGQVALFHLYNQLRERARTLVAAGNAPPMRLALRPDLVTRLAWGLVYQLHALTDEEKMQALASHAHARGFALSGEMCDYLLQRVRRDMPTLLAFVEAIDRHSLETKRAVTMSLLRELVRELASGQR